VSHTHLAALPNHLLSLPPSAIEVGERKAAHAALGPGNAPRLAGALIGGDSGAVRYQRADWEKLANFLRESHRAHAVRWLVTTSRRSGAYVSDVLGALAAEAGGAIERFTDFARAGAGTMSGILQEAEAILVTEDSTMMISEAVGARLPVVGVAPDRMVFEEREAEFRAFLHSRGWYRRLWLSQLTPSAFLDALGQVTPRRTSALDELAAALKKRLPDLLGDA
jgi:hypothetical protein